MKKIFSALLAFCMVLSITAFAADEGTVLTTDAKISVTVDKTEVKAGENIKVTVKTTGDTNGLAYMNGAVKFNYDPTQLDIKNVSAKNMTSDVVFSMAKVTKSESSKTVTLQLSVNQADNDDAAYYLTDSDELSTLKGEFELGSFTATVKNGVSGDIKFELNSTSYLTYINEPVVVGEDGSYILSYNGNCLATELAAPIPTIKVKSAKPVVTFTEPTEGIATYTETASTDTEVSYKVTVKAPIGKVASLNINGTKTALSNGEYTGKATADTAISVTYDDATESVITYTEVYKEDDVSVVFGKVPASATDYGFILDGEWNKFTGEADVVKGGKFAAKGATNGVFAVKFDFNGKAAGNYSAKAYAGETVADNSVVIK